MKYTRVGLGVAGGALGIAALTGCSAIGSGAQAAANGADDVQSAAVGALRDMGFDTTALQAPSTPPSAGSGSGSDSTGDKAGGKSGDKSGKGDRAKKIRGYLRHNTLHGEITVSTKDGTKTLAVQRGTVTAASATSVTVKSTDGYTVTWKVDPKARVADQGKKGSASDVKTGEKVGVAGLKSGSTDTARWIVVSR